MTNLSTSIASLSRNNVVNYTSPSAMSNLQGPPRAQGGTKTDLVTLNRDIIVSMCIWHSADVVQGTFKPARVFKAAPGPSEESADGSGEGQSLQISSVAFDDSGERAVTAGDDDVFTLYDARKGK